MFRDVTYPDQAPSLEVSGHLLQTLILRFNAPLGHLGFVTLPVTITQTEHNFETTVNVTEHIYQVRLTEAITGTQRGSLPQCYRIKRNTLLRALEHEKLTFATCVHIQKITLSLRLRITSLRRIRGLGMNLTFLDFSTCVAAVNSSTLQPFFITLSGLQNHFNWHTAELRAGRSWFKGSIPGERLGIFLFVFRPALGPTQPPIKWVPGLLSVGVKWPGREADHTPPSSAEVSAWSYTSTPQSVFITWYFVKHRDFTFYLYIAKAKVKVKLSLRFFLTEHHAMRCIGRVKV
jgi:hypothetical protein